MCDVRREWRHVANVYLNPHWYCQALLTYPFILLLYSLIQTLWTKISWWPVELSWFWWRQAWHLLCVFQAKNCTLYCVSSFWWRHMSKRSTVCDCQFYLFQNTTKHTSPIFERKCTTPSEIGCGKFSSIANAWTRYNIMAVVDTPYSYSFSLTRASISSG